MRYLLPTLAVCLAIAGCDSVDPSTASEEEASSATPNAQLAEVDQIGKIDSRRPFKAADTLISSSDQDPGLPCPPGTSFHAVEWRAGSATHLGEYTLYARACSRFDFPPPVLHFEVAGYFRAANGDTLWYGHSSQIDFSQAPPMLVGNFTFAGGTGRFASATGTGAIGTVDPTPTSAIAWDGWISYNASDRAD